ncbi:MAG TPA: hypothetical protein VM618_06500 [Acidimicrobiia bacterium]|nr:hypothetical protein [Acidimicrobiia bacterium]
MEHQGSSRRRRWRRAASAALVSLLVPVGAWADPASAEVEAHHVRGSGFTHGVLTRSGNSMVLPGKTWWDGVGFLGGTWAVDGRRFQVTAGQMALFGTGVNDTVATGSGDIQVVVAGPTYASIDGPEGQLSGEMTGRYTRAGDTITITAEGTSEVCFGEECVDGPVSIDVVLAFACDLGVDCSFTATYAEGDGGAVPILDPGSPPDLGPLPENPLLPDIRHASNECGGAGSAAIVDGYVGETFVRLRTAPDGSNTWVCVAVERGSTHWGGKLILEGSSGGPPVAVSVASR